jgi:hypothetical protein
VDLCFRIIVETGSMIGVLAVLQIELIACSSNFDQGGCKE